MRPTNKPRSKPKVTRNFTIGAFQKWPGAIVFSITIIWLLVNIALFSIAEKDNLVRNLFFLSTQPLVALLLLSIAVVGFIGFRRANWKSFVDSLSPLVRLASWLTLLFYASILVLGNVIIKWIGRSITDDWAFLALAAFPLVLALLKLLVDRATSLKAKLGGLEIELQTPGDLPPGSLILSTDELSRNRIQKGRLRDLQKTAERIRNSTERPTVLVIQVSENSNERGIDFFALRAYVLELSRITELDYLIFVDEANKYLGYMTTSEFKYKYPLFPPELFYQGLSSPEDSEFRRFWRHWGPFADDIDMIGEEVRAAVIRKYWDPQGDYHEVKQVDLNRLGVRSISVQVQDTLKVYETLLANGISGVPILDRDRLLIGIATKERIVDQVIEKLLRG